MRFTLSRSSRLVAGDVIAWTLKWLVGAWVLINVVIAVIIGVTAGIVTPQSSIFAYAYTPSPYWMLVLGLLYLPIALRTYIALGVTRREVLLGAAPALAGTCALAAALMTLSSFVEGRVYAAAGWQHDIQDPHLFTSTDQFGLVFAEIFMIFACHLLVGAAVGAAFQKLSWWSVPTILGMYGLAVLVEIANGRGWGAQLILDNVGDFTPSWPIAVATGIAALAVLSLANWRLLRDLPMSTAT